MLAWRIARGLRMMNRMIQLTHGTPLDYTSTTEVAVWMYTVSSLPRKRASSRLWHLRNSASCLERSGFWMLLSETTGYPFFATRISPAKATLWQWEELVKFGSLNNRNHSGRYFWWHQHQMRWWSWPECLAMPNFRIVQCTLPVEVFDIGWSFLMIDPTLFMSRPTWDIWPASLENAYPLSFSSSTNLSSCIGLKNAKAKIPKL